MKKKILGVLALFTLLLVCIVGLFACNQNEDPTPKHTHTYSSEWSYNETHHWHVATCEHTEEVSGKVEHNCVEQVIEPTCTEQGYTMHTCECGYSYKDSYVNALDHEFTEYVSNNDATCGRDGTKTALCNHTGCNETDTIIDLDSKLPHTYSNEWSYNDTHHWHVATCEHAEEVSGKAEHNCVEQVIKPTCTEQGYTMHTCECGYSYKDNYVNALDHEFTEYVSNNDATCGSDGTKTAHCNHTGCNETDTIIDLDSKLPHTYSNEWTYDDTHHWHAATCEHTTEIKDKAEHNFVNGVCSICCKKENSKGLSYTLINGDTEYAVSGIGSCTDTNIVIPSLYNDKPVTTIEERAFYDCDSLKSVTIGNSVTTIGSGAFYDCSSLTSVTIPDSVTTIGDGAFYNCSSLTSVYYTGTIDDWVQINFNYEYANPLSNGAELYINNELLTNANIKTATKINDYAFYGCSSLQNVTIGDSVTTIGEWAFTGCFSLQCIAVDENNDNYKSIDGNLYSKDGKTLIQYAIGKSDTTFEIPDSVTTIGNYAFYGCSSLTSIEIPNSVTTIGSWAFSGCSSLKSVTIGDSVTTIGVGAFYNCSKLQSVYYTGTIDDWVKKNFNGYYANPLYYRAKLYINNEPVTNANIKTATKINDYAFHNCSSLESVTIGNSVINIGNYAFLNCSSLTSVTIGNSVTTIGYSAFYNCYKLVEVINLSELNIAKTSYGLNALNVKQSGESDIVNKDGYLFYTYNNVNYLLGYIGNDTELTLPDNYEGQSYEIYQYAFYGNDKITSVTIGDSVTSIGWDAFYECSSLISVTIGNSVTTIGNSAFSSCSSLITVTIGNGTTTIGYEVFQYCSSLANVRIGNSVTTIGYKAFGGCSSLQSINVDENNKNYKSINGNLYSKDGKTLIQYALGKQDRSFTTPDSVTNIGNYAFEGCSSLTSVTIGNSVTTIGERAFYNCSSLQSVTIGNSVTTIGEYAFYNCSSLTSVTIPDSVTTIGENAFNRCTSLTSVTIPDSVTTIGSWAFYYCSSLKSITFSDPSNWYRGSSTNMKNKTGGTLTDLSNPTQNATYFKSAYYEYYWYKK